MGRSVKGEGRRRGRSKKRENQENLNAKPFLDPDPASPSLDELDPGGKGEATARAAEEVVSFIASSATLSSSLSRSWSKVGDVCLSSRSSLNAGNVYSVQCFHCLLR
ncbi:hypothetical protein BHE74_00041501 [Ensete ventricosum]|nr:hypothetical protein BHE74_00041501 [Ensete ventricosum]